ncbi:hypothetical protein [Roseivivax isoporae]|uniref:Uncharacterized protein n=1 Tax=Roseivivax isoporae LMG 25204 TaxID=1449351 RepID=X7F6N0_9RHOB|nr:hypothetical protein [Roseivivax isoporae]ETX28455.1 hypothetical protein RISW2_06840 [Roseivivax isoporae LMG 25204]
MTRIATLLLALALVGACGDTGNDDKNPLQEEPTDPTDPEDPDAEPDPDPDTDPDTGEPIDSDGRLPPGTASPTPTEGIFRKEPLDEEAGNGFARELSYDGDSDTFFVQGLAFDGDQPDGAAFSRSALGSLTSAGSPGQAFALYEAPITNPDFFTGEQIGQFQHRALYGVGDDTEFAIVRTGSYVPYGFGGFVYQRDGDVVLPTEGQAVYRGLYGGLRDFDGAGGLESVSGDAQVTIDFGGFQGNCEGARCADAVSGFIANRRVYDASGQEVTSDILTAINEDQGTALTRLPTLNMRVGPGVLDANGEITGEIDSIVDGTAFETGNYYAIMSGDHTSGGEIVGIVVVEATDPRFEGSVTVRETGGFIVDR